MDIVFAAEGENQAHLLLRVHRTCRVVGIRKHEHLHLLTLGFRLFEGIFQNLLRNDIVVLRCIRTDQRASIAKGEVVVKGIVARCDAYSLLSTTVKTDKGIVGVEQGSTHNIHHSTRTIHSNDRIWIHRHLEHFCGQEAGHTLFEVLTPIVRRRVPTH